VFEPAVAIAILMPRGADAQRAGLVGHRTRVCSTLILDWAVPSNRKNPLKWKSQTNAGIDGI
jgi:hypothetical protein